MQGTGAPEGLPGGHKGWNAEDAGGGVGPGKFETKGEKVF